MKRQPDAFCSHLCSWQKQTVSAKIMETQTVSSKPENYWAENLSPQKLAGNQMVPLQSWRMAGLPGNIDAAKRQGFSSFRSGISTQEHLAMILAGSCASSKTAPDPARTACVDCEIGP